MASKVLVKIPAAPFSQQVSKKVPELAAIGRSEGLMVAHSSDPLLRVTQLEQNIRFLQEQHQHMLSSLHQEIEALRQRNRDLQFQLVFSKSGVTLIQSNPSSPEDDSRPKIILSPKQFNLTPLQVEILERDIAELKTTLNEAKTKNHYLSGIVEEQKKKLQRTEEEMQKLVAVGHHISPEPKAGPSSTDTESLASDDVGLAIKLEEADKMIRRLRRENDDQKRELVTLKSNLSKSMGGGGGGGGRQLGNHHRGGGGHHHRGGNPQPSQQTHRFPPLHTQSYWHHGGSGQQPNRGGLEYGPHRNGNNSSGFEKENQVVGRAAPSLPHLRPNPAPPSSSFSYQSNQRRGGHYNNSNHYYRGAKEEVEVTGVRKYRGGRGGTGRGPRETKE